jgi:hypothetical protein
MRYFTLQHIKRLVDKAPKLEAARRPLPMPGKLFPTRVAWYIKLVNLGHDAQGHMKFEGFQTHHYIGKPNRLRALEARNFMQKARQPGVLIFDMFQATFDRGGLLGYVTQKHNRAKQAVGCGAFTAYHPHIPPPQVEIIEAFVRPLHIKRVGGMRLYSQKKTLKVEELDAYYEWYLKQFAKKLRRPKPAPMVVEDGVVVGAQLPEPPEAPEDPEFKAVPF